jgi:hypothetical protein
MLSRRDLIRRGVPGALLTARAWTTSAIVRPGALGPRLRALIGGVREIPDDRTLALRGIESSFTSGRYDFGSRRWCERCNDLALVSLFTCGRSYT